MYYFVHFKNEIGDASDSAYPSMLPDGMKESNEQGLSASFNHTDFYAQS